MNNLSHLCPVTQLGYPDTFGGWLGADALQQSIAAQFPAMRDFPSMAREATPSKPILLYKAWNEVLGKQPDYPAQQIGDCVSFGHGHANDLLQCIEMVLDPTNQSSYQESDTEWIYGASREIAGILGIFDGSYGAAAVKAMVKWGTVSREMLGSNGSYSGSRAKAWGRSGPPSDVKTMAGPFKLGSVALIQTWDQLVAAIWNGRPVTICSNQGFTMTRDNQGFCAARGSWAHCMFIAGLRFDRPGALICQSWGPQTPSGPLDLDQPTFSFWAERQTVERILAAGDSWMLSAAPDFATRSIPSSWTIA